MEDVNYKEKYLEKVEEIENLSYENKKMGDFLELLGICVDDITNNIVNGGIVEFQMQIDSLRDKMLQSKSTRTIDTSNFPILVNSSDFIWDSIDNIFKAKENTPIDKNEAINHNETNEKTSSKLAYSSDLICLDSLINKMIIILKEGENDNSSPVSYLISNSVTDCQLSRAFGISSLVWDEIDDERVSFDEIAKKVKIQFGDDLHEILDETIPSSWYLILEKVFENMGINYNNISEKSYLDNDFFNNVPRKIFIV